MTINLQPFCACEWEDRVGLHKPWRDGAWVYATNGHMSVRVPCADIRAAPFRAANQPKNLPNLFRRWFDDAQGEFSAIPPLPKDWPCVMCDSTGHNSFADDWCHSCFGTKHCFIFHPVGDSGFNLHYLHMLAALPQARIRTNGATGAAALIFDGGQALLMPMKDAATRIAL